MIHFTKLETEQHFEEFKREYDRQIAVRSAGRLGSVVKLDYLRASSHPTGCFDRSGRMVGGWVIQEADPLIVLAAMPTQAREAFLATTQRDQLCELTAIWRNDGISPNAFATLVWPKIIFDCVTKHRPHILGIGYRNPMNEIYQRIQPRVIYNGPSQTLADTEVFVYDYSRASLCGTFAANLLSRKLVPGGKLVKRWVQRKLSPVARS